MLTVGFQFPSYTIVEGDGLYTIQELCLVASGGTVGRTVVIYMSDEDGSALGKHY